MVEAGAHCQSSTQKNGLCGLACCNFRGYSNRIFAFIAMIIWCGGYKNMLIQIFELFWFQIRDKPGYVHQMHRPRTSWFYSKAVFRGLTNFNFLVDWFVGLVAAWLVFLFVAWFFVGFWLLGCFVGWYSCFFGELLCSYLVSCLVSCLVGCRVGYMVVWYHQWRRTSWLCCVCVAGMVGMVL